MTTAELSTLFEILQGDSDPASPRTITAHARESLQWVEQAINMPQLTRVDPNNLVYLIIFDTPHTPTAALWQAQGVIEWIHLAHSPVKVITSFYDLAASLIIKGRRRVRELLGSEPSVIIAL